MMRNRIVRLVATILLSLSTVGTTPTLARAACFQPCGSPVSGNEDGPLSADALFTLYAAVGVETTCAACECDVSGDEQVSATDALAVLRRAVGLVVPFACPACTDIAPADATARGRAALERHDIARADDEFQCALAEQPGHAASNFFRALTRIARFVAEDATLVQFFLDAGGEGTLDIYNWVQIPTEAEHPFRMNSNGYSEGRRTPIPTKPNTWKREIWAQGRW